MLKSHSNNKQLLLSLTVAALGVVYGDIGTSPLYAMRVSLQNLPINSDNVLGILSLIFWTLAAVISVKYLIILMRADNEGEGGILALLALVKRTGFVLTSILFLIAIFGAGLLIGDGMLTPAISVLSAIEGLNIALPNLSEWVIPTTCSILVLLFFCQHVGTAKIGFVFGPLILIWFTLIALFGLKQIIYKPIVLTAINPLYAYHFFHHLGWEGYSVLGGIFLVATGAEALYADLGHFGKRPIRLGWFGVALPALLLNYFGQGALLLQSPEAIINPFYMLAPNWFYVPFVILAAVATVIASQAIISATFSLARQAVLLGLYPKIPIVHTSTEAHGQIYIPQMNHILAVGAILLVMTFHTSEALTHAYGIAVNLNMILTTILAFFVSIYLWKWHWLWAFLVFATISVADCAFLGANSQKLITGAWVPLALALICALLMYTWQRGRQYLRQTYFIKNEQLIKILKQLTYKTMHRLPDTTAVFITDTYDRTGGSFLNFLKENRTLPEKILLVNYIVENIPYVPLDQRVSYNNLLKHNICELTLRYGFMDMISVPEAISYASKHKILPLPVDMSRIIYVIEIPNVVASRKKKSFMFFWQEKLFAFLVRNYSANTDVEFYQLPYNHTIALGTYYIV